MADADVVVAMWGRYDCGDFAARVQPRIARHELGRRLPGVRVTTYTPTGWDEGTGRDAGEPSEPLGPPDGSRLDALAAAADVVLVGGGDITTGSREAMRFFVDGLGRTRERHHPVVWHAVGIGRAFTAAEAKRVTAASTARPYVAVRDDVSRRRLVDAGVEREVAVVPDPVFLLPRVVPEPVSAKRRSYLAVMGAFPREGGAIVVHGDRSLVDDVGPIAAAIEQFRDDEARPVVLLTMDDGDDAFADAFADHVAGRVDVYRLPGIASVEDITATVAAADVVVSSTFAGNAAAAALGRPHVVLDLGRDPSLAELAETLHRPEAHVTATAELVDALRYAVDKPPKADVVTRLQAAIDDHFDRVVAVITSSASSPSSSASSRRAEAELVALRRAHEQLGRRVVAERVAMADRVVDLEERLAAATASVQALESQAAWLVERVADTEKAVAWHTERRAAADAELKAIKATKTFRWTSQARAFWSRWQTRRR